MTDNKKYRNIETGKVETSYKIGSNIIKESWEIEPNKESGTAPLEDYTKEQIINEGNLVASEDERYKEIN